MKSSIKLASSLEEFEVLRQSDDTKQGATFMHILRLRNGYRRTDVSAGNWLRPKQAIKLVRQEAEIAGNDRV